MSTPKSSKAKGRFPYRGDDSVCFMELRGGALRQVSHAGEKLAAACRAVAGESVIYAAWPGQWRTALFVVDEPALLLSDAVRRRVFGAGKPSREAAVRVLAKDAEREARVAAAAARMRAEYPDIFGVESGAAS